MRLKKKTVRFCRLTYRRWLGRIFYPRFQKISEATNGMMYAPVYKRLYDEVMAQGDGDIVEVGGAGGTCSIVCAEAKQDAKKSGDIVTVERFEGRMMKRRFGGGYDDNLTMFNASLERFGVRDRIVIFPHYLSDENAGEVHELVKTEKIVGLLHDADGRIDRDIHHFWPRLVDNGFMMIDDVVHLPQRLLDSDSIPIGCRKFIVTVRLLEEAERSGVLTDLQKVRGTVFARKAPGADLASFDRARCQQIVDEIDEEFKGRWNKPPEYEKAEVSD